MREALFSVLGQDISGWTVLDAFAGTGLLSFEALSRGADRAELVELRPALAAAIRRTARLLGVADRLAIRVGRSPGAAPPGPFDLVLVDPPYARDPAPVLEGLAGRVGGWLVLEHASRRRAPAVSGLELCREAAYGDSALAFYRPASAPPFARRLRGCEAPRSSS